MTCCSLLCEGKLKMVDNSQSYRSWPCSSRLRPRYLGFSGPPSSSPTLSKLIHDTRHVNITYDYSVFTVFSLDALLWQPQFMARWAH